MNTQKELNFLAAILFVFGALHAYNLVKNNKISSFYLVKKGIQIFNPLLLRIFITFGLGTTLTVISNQ